MMPAETRTQIETRKIANRRDCVILPRTQFDFNVDVIEREKEPTKQQEKLPIMMFLWVFLSFSFFRCEHFHSQYFLNVILSTHSNFQWKKSAVCWLMMKKWIYCIVSDCCCFWPMFSLRSGCCGTESLRTCFGANCAIKTSPSSFKANECASGIPLNHYLDYYMNTIFKNYFGECISTSGVHVHDKNLVVVGGFRLRVCEANQVVI